MKKTTASILVAATTVTLMLVGVLGLGRVSMRVAATANPTLRAVATVVELIIGILWLLGTIFVATRLAIQIFAAPNPPKTDQL